MFEGKPVDSSSRCREPDSRVAIAGGQFHEDIVYPATIPFLVLHLACFAVIWTGISVPAVALGVALYVIRLFAVSAGYHRYFSHRTYRTSRVAQFLLALLCQTTTQRGVLWWAAIHRYHHLHSDTPADVHSPRQHGFWYAHMGWVFARSNDKPDYSGVQDLTRYPELVWLDRYPYFLPIIVVIIPCWLIAGWSGVIVGFGWSTTLLYHATFAINSLGHASGSRPYVTGDDSRNNPWLALLTMGEGWHNNHHAYQSSARLGFHRREIDLAYWILKLLSRTGIIWDLREPPGELVRNEMKPGRRVVETVAREIAAKYDLAYRDGSPPTFEKVHARVNQAFTDVPPANLTDIARRTHELIVAGPPQHHPNS